MSAGKRFKFHQTTFQLTTGYGSTSAITGISNASTAVVSKTAHGLTTGDVIKIAAVVGMVELNDGLFVVDVVDADSFRLQGVNSLDYAAYVSGGTFAKATYSGSCEVTGYQGDTGATTETTTETNCGKSIDFGAPDPGNVTINYNRAPGPFQAAVETSRTAVTPVALKTTLPGGGGVMIDIGVITQVGRAGQAGGVWTGSATLRRTVDRVDIA